MSPQPEVLEIAAYAKINLYLEVLRRRPDGYHDICSVLLPISLADRLVLTPTPGRVETVIEEGGMADAAELRSMPQDSGLTNRAAQALKRATGFTGGVLIRLWKSIPLGGGLGGGSADAAAVLIALNALWRTGLDRARLMAVGAEVGSDVAGLLHGGAVLVRGRGELASAIQTRRAADGGEWWLVVANPRIAVSTADIYGRCRPGLTSATGDLTNVICSLGTGDVRLAAGSLFNGLQPAVVEKYPLIGIILQELRLAGALGVLVSGSGASAFGLCGSEESARDVERQVKARMESAVWTCVAKALPDGVMAAHGPLEARA